MIDVIEIMKYLPHRYPFLLIDRVISYEAGKTLTAIKNVTINEPFFNGHFPNQPVMPGVLMIEAIAQTCGILYYKTLDQYPKPDEIFYLVGVDEVRYKRLVVPGDQLELKVNFLKSRLDLWKFEGVATVGGEMACSAILMIKKG